MCCSAHDKVFLLCLVAAQFIAIKNNLTFIASEEYTSCVPQCTTQKRTLTEKNMHYNLIYVSLSMVVLNTIKKCMASV